MNRVYLGVVLLSLFAAGPAAAGVRDDPLMWRAVVLIKLRARYASTFDHFSEDAIRTFRRYDVDRDGLDRKDIDTAKRASLERMRAEQTSRVLMSDLDRDGRVSVSEFKTLGQRDPRRPFSYNNLAPDRNADGFVTVEEAVAYYGPGVSNVLRPHVQQIDYLMAFDPNRHGRFTRAEFEALLREQFNRVDADGNGTIDRDEDDIVKPAENWDTYGINGACAFPEARADELTIVYTLGTPQYRAVGATVGGAGSVSYVMDVVIEPGDHPLYIIAWSSEMTIWRVRGAVDRVSRFLPDGPGYSPSGGLAAGVMGLPEEKVVRDFPSQCLGNADEEYRREQIQMVAAASLGRPLDLLRWSGGAFEVSLPSGATKSLPYRTFETIAAESRGQAEPPKVPHGFDPLEYAVMIRSYPGGLSEVDPAAIVMRGAALPSQTAIDRLRKR